MTYFSIHELIEDWDRITVECDVLPKSYPSKADDLDEAVNRFWDAVFASSDGDQEEDLKLDLD